MKKYLSISIILLAVIMAVRSYYAETTSVFSGVVKKMGYEDVVENPFEVVEFTIPQNFNAVYEKYNNMLKENGYDLSLYKGKKCKRYTYLIPSENARANIIVCDGAVIGGDIMSITLDGVIMPIAKLR